ncbi:MAG: chromosome segregation protein SMC [Nitrospirae bacterium]|nr:chromosome segregation protein SMC [Nitrospirota bacterium]
MRLKQITIFGFKSFADRTVITVPPGIVSIVGPNGCGKSNISDSVLWAIGEQSAKTLRADRMEDVLFNGTERRKPMGMAEVSLTFEGLDGSLTSRFGEFSELTVTRRLFRSGESEYLINKVPCRLKDIRDLLLEAGGSFKGHTIIEQGKVDGLINASPVERRGLIEEAAGIAKYKVRKAEAVRKLEATEQNLLRVKDIIGEVKRQINALDRQAKKAHAAQQLAGKIRTLELSLSVHRLQGLRARQADAVRHQGERQLSEAQQLAAVGALEAEIEQLQIAQVEAHQAIRALEQELFAREAEQQQAAGRIEHLREQQAVWATETEQLTGEAARLEEAIARQHEEMAGRQSALGDLHRDQRQREAALQEQQAQVEALERAADEAVQAQETINRQLFAALAAVSEAQNRLTLLQARSVSLQRERERSSNERRRLEEELALTTVRRVEALATRQAVTEQMNKGQAAHHEAQAAIEQGRQALAANEQARGQRQGALTEATVRLASLQELEAGLVRQQTELREALTTYGPLAAADLRGLVADLIEVQPSYERAIEAALAEQLQAFIVDEVQTARSAVAFLKQHTIGRAHFFPTKLADQVDASERQQAAPHPELIPAARLVAPRSPQSNEARDRIEPLIARLLGRVWIVADLQDAIRLQPAAPAGSLLVTVDGDLLLPSGVIVGGHPPEAGSGQGHGLLQQRRLRQQLEAELPQLEAAVADLSRQGAELQERLDATTGEERRQRDVVQTLQMEAMSQQKEVEQLGQVEERLRSQLALLDQEMALLDRESQEADQQHRAVESELAQLAGSRQALEADVSIRSAAVADAAQGRDAAQERLTQLKVDVASGAERAEQLAAAVEHLHRLAEQVTRQRDEKRTRLGWLAAQRQRAEAESGQLREQQLSVTAVVGTLRLRRQTAVEDVAQQEALLRVRQAEEKEQRRRLDQVQELVVKGRQQVLEVGYEVNRVADFLATVYHLTPEAAEAEAAPLLTVPSGDSQAGDSQGDDGTDQSSEQSSEKAGEEAAIASAEQELAALKSKREQLGLVNPAAIEEYEELQQRHEFLTKQEADLTRSMEDLREAIAKINRTTKNLFLETFTELNRRFGELFGRFFPGGHAALALLDEQNPLESGIEIMAQPPGKRLRTIHLLSGGEKALTAIALLMASFLISPSPFCLLDEIDAPLDEENVRRFTTVLKTMTQQTQFLIVTHNKRTMEIADQLYGVTMEEPGVSKIIGVRLDVAEQLAVSA